MRIRDRVGTLEFVEEKSNVAVKEGFGRGGLSPQSDGQPLRV
jgi:hypothetical protein